MAMLLHLNCEVKGVHASFVAYYMPIGEFSSGLWRKKGLESS